MRTYSSVLHAVDRDKKRATHRGYRLLRRTHMFGLRVAMKPCLQKHLYEPAVFTQREFLHGLTRAPGSAHSSMSGRNKHKHARDKTSHKDEASACFCKKQHFFFFFFLQTYTAGAGVVQPKACVAFTHGAQVGADTAAICTAAFIRILL